MRKYQRDETIREFYYYLIVTGKTLSPKMKSTRILPEEKTPKQDFLGCSLTHIICNAAFKKRKTQVGWLRNNIFKIS